MEHEETSLPAPRSTVPPAVPPAQAPPGLTSWEIVSPELEPTSNAPDWRRYVAAVLRHKWLILLLVVVGTAGSAFAAHYLPQEYQAQSTIWIEAQSEGSRGPIRSDQLLRSNAWIELLRSYVVLDYVVREERLYLRPASPADSLAFANFTLAERFRPGEYRLTVDDAGRSYTLATREGIRIEGGTLGDSIGREIGFQWQPAPGTLRAGRTVDFGVSVPREAALELNNDLRTRIDQNGNFLRLELRMPTGIQAASVLNTIGERYLEVAGELKRSRMQELTGILREQLEYAENNLRTAERELEAFRVNTIVLPSDRTPVAPGLQMTQDPVFSGFFDMKVEQEQLRRDREAIQRALATAADSGISTTALEIIPSARSSTELMKGLEELTTMRSELRALRNRYTDEHPPVQRLLGDIATMEQTTIPRLATSVIEQVRTREQVLEDLIGAAGDEMQSIPPRAIEEARLRRQVTIAENLYTTLQQRYEESRLSVASATPDIQILDEATVPHQPVSEQNAFLILLGFVGSLGLGILGAIVRERIDGTIRYPDQVAARLGMPVLGAVPFLEQKKGRTEVLEQATEAFRSLRLNLTHAHGRGPLVVTLTSPGAGDGKSFVTSNLGVSFAELGLRTVVVDGDVRRGVVHRLLERERLPGLTDLLAGSASIDDVIQHTGVERLDVIASGHRTRNSPELLDSRRMRELIIELRNRYDVILVDSSPLGAGVDPFVLGTITGAIALVIRTGTTRQDFTEAKVNLLARLPVRLLGAIMNGIDPSQNSYYHYYSYLPGYGTVDEEQETPRELQSA